MKTQSILKIIAFASIIFTTTNSFAQLSNINNLQGSLNRPVKVYENVQSEFWKLFSNADNVRWEMVERNYLAKFSAGDVEKRALLSPRGKLIYKITFGTEKHLPAAIRRNIKRDYVEFIITKASLVEEKDRSIWVVNLEDESTYVTVRVEDGEMEETQKYRKTIK